MDKTTTEETSCCKTSGCKSLCNNKWLSMILRIAVLLALLGVVFKMGMRVGMGGGMRDHDRRGGMGCSMGEQGKQGDRYNDNKKMKGGEEKREEMMEQSVAPAPTAEVVVANPSDATGTVVVESGTAQ